MHPFTTSHLATFLTMTLMACATSESPVQTDPNSTGVIDGGARTASKDEPTPTVGNGGASGREAAGGTVATMGSGGDRVVVMVAKDAGASAEPRDGGNDAPPRRDNPNNDAQPVDAGKVWQVTTENWKYLPLNLTIKVGDIIEWIPKPGIEPGLHKPTSATKNASGAYAPDGKWESPQAIGPGHLKSWRHQFTDVGTFNYMCTNNASHVGQTGEHATVIVEPK